MAFEGGASTFGGGGGSMGGDKVTPRSGSEQQDVVPRPVSGGGAGSRSDTLAWTGGRPTPWAGAQEGRGCGVSSPRPRSCRNYRKQVTQRPLPAPGVRSPKSEVSAVSPQGLQGEPAFSPVPAARRGRVPWLLAPSSGLKAATSTAPFLSHSPAPSSPGKDLAMAPRSPGHAGLLSSQDPERKSHLHGPCGGGR